MEKQYTFYVKTFGCQMNVYDSDRIAELLEIKAGYTKADSSESADVVVFNTCHIREKAAEKLYSDLGRLDKMRKKYMKSIMQEEPYPHQIVIVAGCVAQAEGKEICRRMPMVDIVVGPEAYHNLPQLITNVVEGNKIAQQKAESNNKKMSSKEQTREIALEFTPIDKFDSLPKSRSNAGYTAFLTVQEGCDNFCSYCVVPITRGREFSRPVSQVYDEALQLVDKGAKEINLLGQNVDAYHGVDEVGNPSTLAKLIKKIAKIEGLERIRYTTSYPSKMDEELIEAHGEVKELMPFLYLPIQAGSNRTLKSMNRHYTREKYLEIIAAVREARPDIALSSDFIVGFAGETEEDFEETLSVIREVNYSQCFSFKYSARPGTRGAKMPNQIPDDVAQSRLLRLQELTNQQQEEFNKNTIGKTLEVLLEEKASKSGGKLYGKSPYLQTVIVDAPESELGKIVRVKIEDSTRDKLTGVIVD